MTTKIDKKQIIKPPIKKTKYQFNVIEIIDKHCLWHDDMRNEKLGTFLSKVKWQKNKIGYLGWHGVYHPPKKEKEIKSKPTTYAEDDLLLRYNHYIENYKYGISVSLRKFYFNSEAALHMALELNNNTARRFLGSSDDPLFGLNSLHSLGFEACTSTVAWSGKVSKSNSYYERQLKLGKLLQYEKRPKLS